MKSKSHRMSQSAVGRVALACCLLAPVMLNQAMAGEAESGVTEGDLKVDHGQVNWSERTIVATGSGAPDLKAPNVAVARLGAERVAKLDALRNILETLKGIRVDSEITVEKEMVTSSKMRSKVEGIVRNFKVLRTKYYSDGGVDLVVEVKLDGKLASTLLESDKKKSSVPTTGNTKNSGLVIDARGLKALPAMAPKVYDESGNLLYSSEYLATEALENHGVVGYFHDVTQAQKNTRVTDKPLVVKALKLNGDSRTDLVLSNADAEKLKDPQSNLKFLTEGRVIVVID